MPEVPEIALTADFLKKNLIGKKLLSVEFVSGRYTKKLPVGYIDFVKNLPIKLKDVDSQGKFLWFTLFNHEDDKWFIWNTFGLTGMWSFNKTEYTRAIFNFGKQQVYFSDMRNFGTFKFNHDELELEKKLKSLGPDFLKTEDIDFQKIKKYNLPIIKILMDQKKVGSGLGNYLTAEILYRAKISPLRLGKKMTDDDISTLAYWIKYTVKLAYMNNGVGYMENIKKETAKLKKHNYHPDIHIGKKSFKFLVYRKRTDPYGNKVVISKIIGGKIKRSTYWVPEIQK